MRVKTEHHVHSRCHAQTVDLFGCFSHKRASVVWTFDRWHPNRMQFTREFIRITLAESMCIGRFYVFNHFTHFKGLRAILQVLYVIFFEQCVKIVCRTADGICSRKIFPWLFVEHMEMNRSPTCMLWMQRYMYINVIMLFLNQSSRCDLLTPFICTCTLTH